jgi:hypothetical protein
VPVLNIPVVVAEVGQQYEFVVDGNNLLLNPQPAPAALGKCIKNIKRSTHFLHLFKKQNQLKAINL